MARKTTTRAVCVCVAACLAAAAFATRLFAADTDVTIERLRPKNLGKLELRLKPSLAAIRSDAPFSIELDLDSTFPDLIDGNLELTFIDDREVRLRLETGSIAVPNGQKSFRLFLPAMTARQERSNFVVRAVFHGAREPLDLGTHDLVVPLKGQRQFLMAAGGADDLTTSHFMRRLALDGLRPADADRSILLTLPVELDLHAIPLDPVGLYPFDVLVFAGEHFSQLTARQLDTISTWVETGGGVVVVPTGVLTPAHTEFLERLAGRDAQAPRFLPDQLGRLRARKPSAKDWLIACRHGYGRALIVQGMPAFGSDGSLVGVDRATWTRAVCFLWNLRPAQTTAILQHGNWQISLPSTRGELLKQLGDKSPRPQTLTSRQFYHWNYSEYDERSPLHPEKFTQADGLRALLFPEEVRVVPFRVVAAILALFLFAIAPADYFVLGLLRCRKFTWFLFPALCVLFTVATVWVARYYTGTIDHRGALVIVDMGEKGKALRTTRIEHIITAGTRPVSTEIKNGLFATTDVQPLNANDAATPSTNVGGNGADDAITQPIDPVDYAGFLPAAFTVTRLSRQWTPSMDRVTTAGAPAGLPPFPWSEIDASDVVAAGGRTALVERLRRNVPDCGILLLSASEELTVPAANVTAGHHARFQNWPTVMAALSKRSEDRLFSLVSRISPNGAGDLEDLSVLDAAEPDGWLLCVAVERGDDLIVFRRLLRSHHRHDLN